MSLSSAIPTDNRTAFLFYTHKASPAFLARIARMREELAGQCDLHVIGYFPSDDRVPAPFRTEPGFHAYGPDAMATLGYPVKGKAPFRITPGNSDMVFIRFALDHPQYQTFWLMEWDAVFTGPLPLLCGAFAESPSDLIGTNIIEFSPHWHHLHMNVIPPNWPGAPVLRAFLPVMRFSRRLIDAVDAFYRDGGGGHYEITWIFVALSQGMEVEDLGGDGRFVRPGNKNRFYTSTARVRDLYPGTFRYRPTMRRPGGRPNMLYHPVKDDPEALSHYLYERLRILARRVLLPRARQ